MEKSDASEFIVVDLDIISRSSLLPLSNFFGKRVITLCNEWRSERTYYLSVEPDVRSRRSSSPEKEILFLLNLVESLPSPLEVLWTKAYSRTFDIGFRGGQMSSDPNDPGLTTIPACRHDLSPATILLLGKLKATIRITVYPYDSDSCLPTKPD